MQGRLRHNQLAFDAHIRSMEDALDASKREFDEVRSLMRQLEAGRSQAAAELQTCQTQLAVERRERDRQLAERRKEAATAQRMEEWRKQREAMRAELAAEVRGAAVHVPQCAAVCCGVLQCDTACRLVHTPRARVSPVHSCAATCPRRRRLGCWRSCARSRTRRRSCGGAAATRPKRRSRWRMRSSRSGRPPASPPWTRWWRSSWGRVRVCAAGAPTLPLLRSRAAAGPATRRRHARCAGG